MDNIKQWNKIHILYKKYLQDCRDKKINANSFGNWLKNNYIAPQSKQVKVEPEVKPLVSECQLTIDEFTGIGLQFGRDFGCNQWQSKPSV